MMLMKMRIQLNDFMLMNERRHDQIINDLCFNRNKLLHTSMTLFINKKLQKQKLPIVMLNVSMRTMY